MLDRFMYHLIIAERGIKRACIFMIAFIVLEMIMPDSFEHQGQVVSLQLFHTLTYAMGLFGGLILILISYYKESKKR